MWEWNVASERKTFRNGHTAENVTSSLPVVRFVKRFTKFIEISQKFIEEVIRDSAQLAKCSVYKSLVHHRQARSWKPSPPNLIYIFLSVKNTYWSTSVYTYWSRISCVSKKFTESLSGGRGITPESNLKTWPPNSYNWRGEEGRVLYVETENRNILLWNPSHSNCKQ